MKQGVLNKSNKEQASSMLLTFKPTVPPDEGAYSDKRYKKNISSLVRIRKLNNGECGDLQKYYKDLLNDYKKPYITRNNGRLTRGR